MTALLAVAVKGLIVLLAAALGARLLRHAPASARHGVWAVAFAVLVLLPVLQVAGPAWTVGVLPATSPAPPAPPSPPPPPPVPPVPPPLAPGAVGSSDGPGYGVEEFEREVEAFDHQVEAFGDQMASFDDRVASLGHGAAVVSRSRNAGAWALGVWALGTLAVGLGWVAACAAARRVVGGARPETDAEWTVTAERARRLAGLTGPVRLLRSDALDVPVAWGWGAPAVVLPSTADGWDEGRREAVLLHEMAHLARRDAWTQAVAQVALAVHWMNPLAWWAYRRFLDARERACDDAVLRGGARPSAYAAHLVGVARAVRRDRLALAALAPMARTAPIEGRVVSVLDPDRRRGPARRRVLLGTAALAVAVGLPLAALRPVARAQTTPTPAASVPTTSAPAASGPSGAAPTAARPDTTDDPARAAAPDPAGVAWDDVDAAAERARTEAARRETARPEAARDGAPARTPPPAASGDRRSGGADGWTVRDEVAQALDEADQDIEEARTEIREMIEEAVREGGPGAALHVRALREAEQALAAIDRQAIRDQALRALDPVGVPPVPPTPPVPPVPPSPAARPAPRPSVDWSDVDRARRDALRQSRSSRRSR